MPTNDSEVVEYTYAEVCREVNRWQHTLVRAAMGFNMSFASMERYVAYHCSMVTKPEVRLTCSGVFLFTFASEQDMVKVLEGRWTVASTHPLLLQRWRPGLRLDPRKIASVHLWITLPKLDFQFWSEDMLCKIAGKVGKPLVTDKFTAIRKCMSYPRILVEVNAY